MIMFRHASPLAGRGQHIIGVFLVIVDFKQEKFVLCSTCMYGGLSLYPGFINQHTALCGQQNGTKT